MNYKPEIIIFLSKEKKEEKYKKNFYFEYKLLKYKVAFYDKTKGKAPVKRTLYIIIRINS